VNNQAQPAHKVPEPEKVVDDRTKKIKLTHSVKLAFFLPSDDIRYGEIIKAEGNVTMEYAFVDGPENPQCVFSFLYRSRRKYLS